MDPEIKSLVEENNKMLHKLIKAQKRLLMWRVLKFLFFVGLTLGSFYFLEPYINTIKNFYGSFIGAEQKIINSSDPNYVQNLVEKFQNQ